jgi:hypothetical protein
MLWTVFMLLMFVWMLGLVLEFRLGAIPLGNRAYNRDCLYQTDSALLGSIEEAGGIGNLN